LKTNNYYIKLAEEFFPFKTFKTHQREQLEALLMEQKVLWEAPTGFGKTVIAVTATIPYLLDKEIKKIFIFVRTKTQVYRILDECNKITSKIFDQQKKKIISAPLVAKHDLCIHERKNTMKQVDCILLKCPLKDKPFPEHLRDKIKNKLFMADVRKTEDYIFLIKELKDLDNHCPYYVLYPFIKNADIVITTHAWITNSNLKAIFEKDFEFVDVSNYGIILDEVHNFRPARTIELKLSLLDEILTTELPLQSKKFIQELKDYVLQNINKRETYIVPLLNEKNSWKLQLLDQDYFSLIESFHHYKYFREISIISNLKAFFDAVYDIWYIDQKVEEQEGRQIGIFYLVKEIVFPTKIFENIKHAKRSIYMSGTLFPLPAYRELYDIKDFSLVAVQKEVQNILYVINTEERLSSVYRNRTKGLFNSLAVFIYLCHQINKAHTIVFNTSKKFSESLHTSLEEYMLRKKKKFDVYVESTSAANQQMIETLRYTDNDIILATMGGSLSEGVEIRDPTTKKSKIRLVILTGIPFPPPNIENTLLEKFYTHFVGKARADLFLKDLNVYQKIQQAAGRGIRSHDIDYCAIICTDYRLQQYTIWKDFNKTKNINLILQKLYDFYDKNKDIDVELEKRYKQEKEENSRKAKLKITQSSLQSYR
jgi:Rad3-related DNA helicase